MRSIVVRTVLVILAVAMLAGCGKDEDCGSAGGDSCAVVEPLDAETSLRERIMLGLRLAEGLDLQAAAEELGVPALPPERQRALDRLSQRGRVQTSSGRLRIPKPQWLFADGIISELL